MTKKTSQHERLIAKKRQSKTSLINTSTGSNKNKNNKANTSSIDKR